MSRRAGWFLGALSLLAVFCLVAASLASADMPPTPLHAPPPGKLRKVGESGPTSPAPAIPAKATIYRLSANLTPVSGSSAASGRLDGILVHVFGPIGTGTLTKGLACSSSATRPAPPRAGVPRRIACKASGVPPFTVPASGQAWVLGWRLTSSHLSSDVTSAVIRLNAPAGAAPIAAASLCSTACAPKKTGRTTLTAEQASATVKGEATVVVSTVDNPSGEISGPIVVRALARVAPPAVPGK